MDYLGLICYSITFCNNIVLNKLKHKIECGNLYNGKLCYTCIFVLNCSFICSYSKFTYLLISIIRFCGRTRDIQFNYHKPITIYL